VTAASVDGAKATEAEWDGSLPETAHLLQSYRWGELQSRFGWDVERPAIDVAGATLPLTLLTAPTRTPGGRHGYVPRGPAVPAERMADALSSLATLAGERGLAYLRVEPDIEAPFVPPPGWRPGPTTQPGHSSILDIRPDLDDLLAGFKPKTRYNIRLADRKGVQVERSEDVAAFAAMARVTSSRHGIQLAEEPYYRAVLELLASADMARLYLASHEGTPLAGIIVTRFKGRAIYLFGASAPTGRQLMPAYLLHWRAIQDLHHLGDGEYDLWGIPPNDSPDHPWAGLYQFKSGWSGRTVEYAGAYTHVSNATIWRGDQAVAKISGNVRRVRSKLRL
jgi:lipid II:glycine glycyltransferase (peptidoglycan interpeptide bridge formation enzyme)